jgi:LCP family protein required for cell wall assembly
VKKKWRVRNAVVLALVAIVSIGVGFLIFRGAVQQQVALRSAKTAFGGTKLNVLILGYQEDEATTDTIMLVHLDVGRRTATLVSIPRDTWVDIPRHGFMKINAAYAFGGPRATARAVQALLGGPSIDAIVAAQPEGAAAIVDVLGGLDVNVDENMDYDDNYGGLHIHFLKGQQHLNGAQVSEFVRFRHDATSDFGRVARQQEVVKLLLAQVSQPQNWAKLPRIMRLARKQIVTTMSDRQLISLLTIYRNVPDDNVRSFTLPSKAGWAGDASVVFADQRWARLIGSVLFAKRDPPQDEVLVVNATGNVKLDGTVVGALRGAGWNVPTFVDTPRKRTSVVKGSSLAAASLAKTFATALRPGAKTALVLGADLLPDED